MSCGGWTSVISDGLKDRVRSLKMACAKVIRLFLILVLISVFIYWAIGAYVKYELEPISTSTEYRLGDDDLGNFSLPVITFFLQENFRIPKCKKIHRDKIKTEGTTGASISCMQEYDNVTSFMKSVHVPRVMKRNNFRINSWEIPHSDLTWFTLVYIGIQMVYDFLMQMVI